MKLITRSSMPVNPLGELFENFFNRDMDFLGNGKNALRHPSVNVIETETDYQMEVAAPGMNKSDFNLSLDDNLLTISAETKSESEKTEKNYTRREFSFSNFKRSFHLPDNINTEKIDASYKDGVLNITLPKMVEEKKDKNKVIKIS